MSSISIPIIELPSKILTINSLCKNTFKICFLITLLIPITISGYKEQEKSETFEFIESIIKAEEEYLENQKKLLSEEDKFLYDYMLKEEKAKFTNLRLEDILKDNNDLRTFSIPLAKYFLKFSSYAYCSDKEIQTQICCTELFTEDQWTLIADRRISYDNYNFDILINSKYKKIVLSFSGTQSTSQLIKELVYSYGVEFNEDRTEKIMNYSKTVFALFKYDIENTVDELSLTYNDYQFIFTGHSLGGSMAAVSVLNSVKYKNLKTSNESPVLITYGQPRVGNDIFANEVMKYIPLVYRVTRYGDIVSNIPPCAISLDGIFKYKCKSVFPGFKFDRNFIPDDKQRKASETNYYNWHTAGWMHFSDDMTTYEDCGQDYGENFINEKCKLSLNLDIRKHLEYFGLKVSDLCRSS